MAIPQYVITEPWIPSECQLAEGPVYVPETGTLYFVDIKRNEVLAAPTGGFSPYKVKPSTGVGPEIEAYGPVGQGPDLDGYAQRVRRYRFTEPIGMLARAPIEAGPDTFVVLGQRGPAVVDFSKLAYAPLRGPAPAPVALDYAVEVYADKGELGDLCRFNDGNVDSKGRIWAGTMLKTFDGVPDPRIGSLYRFDSLRPGAVAEVVSNCGIPNGLGWSKDETKMYFTDSKRHCIDEYDYDAESGAISNPRLFISVPGVPTADGMTMSDEGEFFVAVWGANRVRRYDQTGRPVEEYVFPAESITCPVFGGPNHDELFVTSMVAETEVPGDRGGDIFRIRLPGVRGVAYKRASL
ncbi:uncharacterized protein V1510DRAFT_381816 [Dipodascopsis tothii]|uniref:uncharacterized protein n=1 Tax=Dipodascopsis tothii TaxID=44089 RepID=UPI0034CFDBA2